MSGDDRRKFAGQGKFSKPGVIFGFPLADDMVPYVSPVAGEQTKTLKAGPGKLAYLRVCNTTGAKRYAFVFDSLTATGTLIMSPIPIPPNDFIEIQTFEKSFKTGCTVSSSTTQTVYGAGGANDLQIDALTR